MKDFTIHEYFSKSEIEFDQRFNNIDVSYEYLAKNRWPNGFICERCGHNQKGPESGLYGAHLIVSLVKRLIRSTFQGRIDPNTSRIIWMNISSDSTAENQNQSAKNLCGLFSKL